MPAGKGAKSLFGGSKNRGRNDIDIIEKNSSYLILNYRGHLIQDDLSFCSNRLNHFSCLYWIPYKGNYMTMTQSMTENMQKHERSGPLRGSLSILIFMIYLILTFLVIHLWYKYSYRYLSLCFYFIVISLVEVFLVCIELVEEISFSFLDVRVIVLAQFWTSDVCQCLMWMYQMVMHFQSGAYIGLAVDLCRYYNNPIRMAYRMNMDWLRNSFIAVLIIILILNAQYFWTFEVVEHEDIVLIHQKWHHARQCDFAASYPLDSAFVGYIWPLIDIFLGEIAPVISVTAAILYIFWRHRREGEDGCLIFNIKNEKRFGSMNSKGILQHQLLGGPLALEMFRSIVFCLVFVNVVLFSRMAYVLTKFVLFSELGIQAFPVENNMAGVMNSGSKFGVDGKTLFDKQDGTIHFIDTSIHVLTHFKFPVKFFILTITSRKFRQDIKNMFLRPWRAFSSYRHA